MGGYQGRQSKRGDFQDISGDHHTQASTTRTTKMDGKTDKDVKEKDNNWKQVTAIIVGAGCRGHGYSSYGLCEPEKFKVVGVCDPREYHRNIEITRHQILPENTFSDWQEAAKREKFADCVVICTPDRLHKAPAIAFAEKGYHVLLEKPMATTESDCREIVETSKKNNIVLLVCHVLRYTPWVKMIKNIIDSGAIGQVVNINHTEPVGYWHFAHSYVRGNWHKEADSSFSLLAKCCHDVDLICYWMGFKKCERVSSFGNLSHFRKEDKVGYWHFAHSFVRGNWHKEADSSFSLLAKCCHDVDLICYWMGFRKCERVSSFGNLSHFRKEDKPQGAASRCLDCPASIEKRCPYSAKQMYLKPVEKCNIRKHGWPISVLADVVDVENITDALRNGPYGKCVYDTDNDVMSHQVVNMQFEGGATATLQMVAFTSKVCQREVKIYGTMGEIILEDDMGMSIKVNDFRTGATKGYDVVDDEDIPSYLSGHGGADYHTIKAFIGAIQNSSSSNVQTGPDETLASHLLTFAAERARKENKVLNQNSEGYYV